MSVVLFSGCLALCEPVLRKLHLISIMDKDCDDEMELPLRVLL